MSPRRLVRIALALRGLLAEQTGDEDIPWNRPILSVDDSSAAAGFAASVSSGDLSACPVPLVDPGGAPMLLDDVPPEIPDERLRELLGQAVGAHVARHGTKPRVIVARGEGVIQVARPAASTVEDPLENAVAIVTGAAGAIGSGVTRGLLEHGCRVAATDLPGERLDRFAAEFARRFGEMVCGVPVDVTDPDSVAAGFDAVVRRWGGVDIVIVNAGIPLIAALEEMSLADFRALESVNVEGAMLTMAEAGRRMRLQGTGGDIVLISTKNVFSPGARFGAYSATKAAAHQLARIASLEMAEFGVRVNMVAPDAVFEDEGRKSGLWEKIGPDRMKHRGIDEKGLREYYRRRNLLKARVTARHVANAVLFFVTHQTPTTGATIPVDGGLPDATPR